jgi:tRNA(fMet)-specific endonuclease VapC
VDFDTEAAARFELLKRVPIRIGSMDLKIAAIALAREATLLTRNLIDFRKVPGLSAEDWSG